MFDLNSPKLSAPLIEAIEDAVMFGNIKEIDGILDLVRGDDGFPDEVRRALETLLYFRQHYGKGGPMEPTQQADRQKVAQMESSWGRDLIDMIGRYPDPTKIKCA